MGKMRVVHAVPVPCRARVRLNFSASHAQQLEAAKENLPDIAILRRQRSIAGEPLSAFPRKRQFDRPALVGIGVVVQSAVDMCGALETGKAPSKERPAQPARIRSLPEGWRLPIIIAAERHGVVLDDIELRHIKEAAFTVGIAPRVGTL